MWLETLVPRNLLKCAFLCTLVFVSTIQPDSACALAQEETPAFCLRIAVDEVDFEFHAMDFDGQQVNDLSASDLHLLDNGKPPSKILKLERLENSSIRIGLMLDTSPSIQSDVAQNRTIAREAVRKLMRREGDQAFVMDFSFVAFLAQPLTTSRAALVAAIDSPPAYGGIRSQGTGLYNALYNACQNFPRADDASSGNAILLFSDGEDNASRTTFEQAVDICQKRHVAIYAFRTEPKEGAFNSGARILTELAEQTGGQALPGNAPDDVLEDELRSIESNLRSRFRVSFRPAAIKHDGAFHRIEMQGTKRVAYFNAPTGYYAPVR